MRPLKKPTWKYTHPKAKDYPILIANKKLYLDKENPYLVTYAEYGQGIWAWRTKDSKWISIKDIKDTPIKDIEDEKKTELEVNSANGWKPMDVLPNGHDFPVMICFEDYSVSVATFSNRNNDNPKTTGKKKRIAWKHIKTPTHEEIYGYGT